MPLEYLLEKYPNKDWDWEAISEHPNLELEWIKKLSLKEDWDQGKQSLLILIKAEYMIVKV